jgi:hypothetical protein
MKTWVLYLTFLVAPSELPTEVALDLHHAPHFEKLSECIFEAYRQAAWAKTFELRVFKNEERMPERFEGGRVEDRLTPPPIRYACLKGDQPPPAWWGHNN